MRNLTSTANVLRQALKKHNEWLLDADGKTFYLLSNEISVDVTSDRLRLCYVDDSGVQKRWVRSVSLEEGSTWLRFEGARDDPRTLAKLVPRSLALDLKESVEAARLELVNSIAFRFAEQIRGLRLLRVALNENNGRFAEVIAQRGMRQVAILADVSGAVTHEAILSKAFVWFRSLSGRKKIEDIWIVTDSKSLGPLRAIAACLNTAAAAKIRIWKPAAATQKDGQAVSRDHFEECKPRHFNSLWSGSLPRLRLLKQRDPTRFSAELKAADTKNIDRVFSARGETLRYKGLAFARTRVMAGVERAWFGIEKNRVPLSPETEFEFAELVSDLAVYRRHDSENKQHEFYRAAPEAWLESILRRNIKALDANLVLSPIYNQFRAVREKIDLLALRRDGRLVIIELKIAPDREMVFQAVDYWRKVESQRKRGNLNKARLFGDAEIANRPTLVYLVAPTLGFHNDLDFLAGKISEKIEIYRFDLAENWRERISVLQRRRVGGTGN